MSETDNLVLQNRRLHEEVRRRVEQMTAVNTVAATIGHSLDLNVTLQTALEVTTRVIGAEAAGISLIDEDAGEIVLRAQSGWLNDFVQDNPMRVPLGQGHSGRVISNDQTAVYNDMTEELDFAVPSFGDEAFRSMVMAPMHARGKIIGILSCMSHQAHHFEQADVDLLNAIADTVGVAIDNARLYEQHVEQENRLKAILHSTADGIVATDLHSRISLVNQSAAQMLGISPASVIGMPLREAAIQTQARDKLLLALSPEADASDQSFEVSLENGLELSVIVSPVRFTSQLSNGYRTDGWVIVLQDITHLRQAEIARVRFIQAAAHDMKNPLSVTQSSLRMLDGMIECSDDTVNEVINIALSSTDRVQRLIDDLLQIEKIESGYGFNRDAVDVREMVHEVNAQMKPLLLHQNIAHDLVIADDVPRTLHIDREWVARALHNYLENAAKYTGDGGKVTFQVYVQDEAVHFCVKDNGPGIPLKAQARLFDRFFRVDDRKDIRGSGLGLAIVRSVAEAHGGRAYVRSQEGAGSTFGIALPLTENASAHA